VGTYTCAWAQGTISSSLPRSISCVPSRHAPAATAGRVIQMTSHPATPCLWKSGAQERGRWTIGPRLPEVSTAASMGSMINCRLGKGKGGRDRGRENEREIERIGRKGEGRGGGCVRSRGFLRSTGSRGRALHKFDVYYRLYYSASQPAHREITWRGSRS